MHMTSCNFVVKVVHELLFYFSKTAFVFEMRTDNVSTSDGRGKNGTEWAQGQQDERDTEHGHSETE